MVLVKEFFGTVEAGVEPANPEAADNTLVPWPGASLVSAIHRLDQNRNPSLAL